MKIPHLCTLHTEEREIMTSCETNTLGTEILMCLNVFYYDTIYFYIFFLLFSIYRTTTNNLYWCSLISFKGGDISLS